MMDKPQFKPTGNLSKTVGVRHYKYPKKDGMYLCRTVNKKLTAIYDFISYYKKRGWLTNRTVTHWLDIVNPEPGDQDSTYYDSIADDMIQDQLDSY